MKLTTDIFLNTKNLLLCTLFMIAQSNYVLRMRCKMAKNVAVQARRIPAHGRRQRSAGGPWTPLDFYTWCRYSK